MQGFSLPRGLVGHLSPELPQAHIADRQSQLAVPFHAFHIEVFEHHYPGTQRRICCSGLPEQALYLLLLHLFRHVLRQGRRFYRLRVLAFPWFDLGFRFWQGGSDLEAAGGSLFGREASAGETTGALVQGITSDVGDAGILAGQLLAGFGAILTALGFTRKAAVQAADTLEFGAQGLGVLNRSAIGALCQRFDAYVNPDGFPVAGEGSGTASST